MGASMPDDVVLNKAAIIERCVARVREVHAGDDANLHENATKQDSIILNIQRACEATIDLAMHIVKTEKLGVPQETRDAFQLLSDADKIDSDFAQRLMRMVGFRNVAVHDYRKLNLEIVESIIKIELEALIDFSKWAIQNAEE
jgi:uncharacterized protein YutE (UPF0331/DUF86 family)